MNMTGLEEVLKELEILKKQNRILKDRSEIENLMGRYSHLHSLGRDREALNTLWSKKDSATLEDGFSGVYELHGRIGGIQGYYRKFFGMPEDASAPATEEPGRMYGWALSSPVIEIAEDGGTAKGLWMCSGYESRVYPAGKLSGIPSVDSSAPAADGSRHAAFWVWSRVAVDFILEDGAWKIWHLHVYDIFRTPYHKDWVEYASERCADDESFDAQIRCCTPCVHATLPTRYHWQYAPDAVPPSEPLPPAPYRTWSEP